MKLPFKINIRGKLIEVRRFNVIDRAAEKARQQIMAQEDENIFKMLDGAHLEKYLEMQKAINNKK